MTCGKCPWLKKGGWCDLADGHVGLDTKECSYRRFFRVMTHAYKYQSDYTKAIERRLIDNTYGPVDWYKDRRVEI